MSLSSEEKRRVAYLEQKLNFFDLQLGRLEQYLESTHVDPANAKIRAEKMSTLFDTSMKYYEELNSLQSGNRLAGSFLETESRYYQAAGAISKLQQRDSVFNSTLNPNNITLTERQELPKLPKIKIPVFDGKQENWAMYKNKFIALVHSRTDISDAVKCSQLFDSLTRPALAKISQYDPSDQDYSKAWKSLLEFYDHKRIVAVEHLNALIDLPQLTKVSADDLSSLLDKARQHLHILEGIGVPPGENLLVRIIERCLPQTLRSRWQDKLNMDEVPKLDDLFKFIQTAIFKQQALDSAAMSNRNPNPKKRPGESLPQSANKFSRKTPQTFVTSSKSDSSSYKSSSMSCPKCSKAHRLYMCPTFNDLSVQDRWKFIKSIKACKNCLWAHPYPCRSGQVCKRCKGEHHTLLHEEQDAIASVSSQQ
ncbi:uncharacterized protein LOC107045896 [Diachasma alloeum]|uniref:uncharacterized protein LOC107045896 n=1 Tax=Diachasma alloeum TaxID=454923 RepID=UPI0007381DB1|nr:uncharacterized protein LOC107045896 [Diachasma alloeum]